MYPDFTWNFITRFFNVNYLLTTLISNVFYTSSSYSDGKGVLSYPVFLILKETRKFKETRLI